jgi:uncharacterized protein (TIRG00374 family)
MERIYFILLIIGRFLLAALFIGIILYFVPAGEIWSTLLKMKPGPFLFALALTPILILFKAVKWYILVCDDLNSKEFWPVLKSILIGTSLAIITPARTGELARVFWLDSSRKMHLSGLVLVDKAMDFVSLAILSSLALYTFLPLQWGIMLLVLVMMCLFLVYNGVHSAKWMSKLVRAIPLLPFKEQLVSLVECLNTVSRIKITYVILLSLLAAFLTIPQGYALVLAFGKVGFMASAISWPLIILTNIIPLGVGGLGTREGVAVLLLSGYFKVARAAALNASLMYFGINTVLPGLIGAFLAATSGIKERKNENL